MAWMALGALVLWLLAVVVVKRILTRRWPDTGFVVLDWRRWSTGDWVSSLLAATALITLAGTIVLAVTGLRYGPHLKPPWPWAFPGSGLIVGSISVMVWSQLTMGESWRIGVDRDETTGLVTAGPFRWVRNPIYSAMTATAIGLDVLMPALGTLVGTLAVFAFVEWQVRVVEEPLLVLEHGRDYVVWSAKSGRFVPRIGCTPPKVAALAAPDSIGTWSSSRSKR